MIHILTVHHKSLDWIPIQYAHISANMNNFKIWTFIDGIGFEPWPYDFDFHFKKNSEIKIGAMHGHWRKLDKLVSECLVNEPDDDIVMFLDGDAFPVRPINDIIQEALDNHDFYGIVRKEMGHDWPHPSFSCCKLGFWRKHNLTWQGAGDPGMWLRGYFKRNDIKWKRMLRTHSLTWHPVLFGIYEGLVYHHSSAFRKHITTRWDTKNPDKTKSAEERMREAQSIFDKLNKNVDFFKNMNE